MRERENVCVYVCARVYNDNNNNNNNEYLYSALSLRELLALFKVHHVVTKIHLSLIHI